MQERALAQVWDRLVQAQEQGQEQELRPAQALEQARALDRRVRARERALRLEPAQAQVLE